MKKIAFVKITSIFKLFNFIKVSSPWFGNLKTVTVAVLYCGLCMYIGLGLGLCNGYLKSH